MYVVVYDSTTKQVLRGLSGAVNNTDLPAGFLPGVGESLSELITEDEPQPLLDWDDVNQLSVPIYTYNETTNQIEPIV